MTRKGSKNNERARLVQRALDREMEEAIRRYCEGDADCSNPKCPLHNYNEEVRRG